MKWEKGLYLGGPKAASKGFLNLIYFTGVLSMSLGIINLFPLPALDGGQLFMLLIGFALFIILSVLVTYRDIVKLVT